MAFFVGSAIAQNHDRAEKASGTSAASASVPASPESAHDGASSAPAPDAKAKTDERIARLEGEKRFRTNCGRCHQPPHKFPPRVMATAIRHMRVRAMITDEDMRLILQYMTQ
jgi:mono/diheme cytochrome c family protein